MKTICAQLCEVCGKGKGGGFRGIDHGKCAKVLQEKRATQKKKTTTRHIGEKQFDYFAKTGE